MREWRKKQLRINPVKYKLQAMVRRAKVRAKKKDIPFTLDWEQLIPLAKDKCPYFTEIKLDWGNKEKGITESSPTLDRIIPEKGYVPGNIIVVSNKANGIKSNATPDEIIKVGKFYKKLLEEMEDGSETD